MIRLFKAELYKLFKNRSFKVVCIIAAILSTLMLAMSVSLSEDLAKSSMKNLSEKEITEQIENIRQEEKSDTPINPGQLGFNSSAWSDEFNPTSKEVFYSSFGSGVIEIFIGILVGALMAKEYSEGTIKNTLAYGKKREYFYFSKFLSILIGVIIVIAIQVGISTIGHTFIRGWGEEFKFIQLITILKTFLVSAISYSAVVGIIMLVSTILKSNGAVIGVSVGIFILLPTIASFFYGSYTWFDRIYELTPFYNSAVAISITATNSQTIKCIVISLVSTIISLILGTYMLKKQDIK